MRAITRSKLHSQEKRGFENPPLLERTTGEADLLGLCGKRDHVAAFLEKGRVAGHETIPDELQDSLARRLESKTYWGMVRRLLSPLAIPAIAAALFKSMDEAIQQKIPLFGVAIVFFSFFAASAAAGNFLAGRFEKRMAKVAGKIVESGNVCSGPALSSLAFIIRSAKDADTAFAVLWGEKTRNHPAETELCLVIGEHGTAEQAKTLLEAQKVSCPFSIHILGAKACTPSKD